MPDVLVLIANTPIRQRHPRISAIVSSCLRAIILGAFGFQGRFPARAVELHDDGPFWPKAYMLSRMTFGNQDRSSSSTRWNRGMGITEQETGDGSEGMNETLRSSAVSCLLPPRVCC